MKPTAAQFEKGTRPHQCSCYRRILSLCELVLALCSTSCDHTSMSCNCKLQASRTLISMLLHCCNTECFLDIAMNLNDFIADASSSEESAILTTL